MGMWDSPTSSYGQHFEAYFQENIKFTHSKSEGYRVQDIKPLGFLILVFYISQVCSHIYVNNNVCVKWFDGKGRQYNTVMSIRKNSFFSNFIMVICQFYIITHNTALVMTCFIMILTWTPVTASENMYLLRNDYYIVS